MALVKFVKIRLMGWKSYEEDVLEELQQAGIMEIAEISEENVFTYKETSEDMMRKISQVEFCMKSLGDFHKKGLLESLLPEKMEVSFNEYQAVTEKFPISEVYEDCREKEEKLRELNIGKEMLKTKFRDLLPWSELQLTFEELNGTDNAELLPVKVPRRSFATAREKIEKIGFVKIVSETKASIHCLLIYLRKEQDSLEIVLKDSDSEILQLPEADSSEMQLMPQDVIKKIEDRLKEIDGSIENLKMQAEKTSSCFPSLLILHDHLSNIRTRKDTLRELKSTQSVFILDGWIREKDMKGTIKKLERKFPEVHAEVREPDEGEIQPVELENKSAVQPFETVTGLYGLPGHREMDPTPLLAPFFALFFALCLTDAGYGLLLTILSFYLLRKFNLGKGGRELLKLLAITGIVTIVVGCLTGGIFGFQFEEAPQKLQFLRTFRNSVMLIDPMEQYLIFFLLCLGLGFVQVWFGFFIKMYQELKNRNFKDAVFGQVPWLILLPGLILLGLVKTPEIISLGLVTESPLASSWGPIAKTMVMLGFFGMFVQPGGGNILKRIGLGVYRLYGVVGCFGDILSYVRLFALGLATMAMAISVNTMAGIAMKIPKIGIIVAIPIVIGGHLFNMVINALSGFIHTLRLQFVEFFTKFYQGGGRAFQPFTVENRYIDVK